MQNKEETNPATRSPVIVARDLEVTFPGNDDPILAHVNFHVPCCSITCLAGPSGVGKSTLLNIAIGRLEPSGGVMEVFGRDVSELSTEEFNEIRRRMGVVYQSGALFQSMSLLENVMFPLVEREGVEHAEAEERARNVLKDVEITPDAYHLTPDRLSGGQKKRGGLARALVSNPELLLCDEPTSGLDPVTAMKIDELFLKVKEQHPEQTMVIVSHDLRSINDVMDEIVFVHEHREHTEFNSVRVQGCREEIMQDSDPLVQQFFKRSAQGAKA